MKKTIALSVVTCSLMFGAGNDDILEQVEINETRLNDPIEGRKNSSTTKIIVSKEEIERFDDQTIGEVLKRLPGMGFTGPAGYVEDIRFRGADKGYTQILIDGEPIADGKKDRQMQVSRLSADMIERIEIIRQTTAEYNSDGVAGTINIVLKDAPNKAKGNWSATYANQDGTSGKEAYLSFGNKYDKLSYIVSINALDRPWIKPKDKLELGYNATTGAMTSIKTEYEVEKRENTELSIIPKINYDFDDKNRLTLSGYFITGTEKKDKTKDNTEDTGTLGVLDKLIYTDEQEDKDRDNGRIMLKYETTFSPSEKYSITAMINRGGEEKDKSTLTRTTTVSNGNIVNTAATEYEKITETENKIKADASFVLWDSNFIKSGIEYSLKDFESDKSKNGVVQTGIADNLKMDEDSLQAYVMDEWNIGDAHVLTPGLRMEQFTQKSLDSNGVSKEGDYRFWNPSLHYLWRMQEDLHFRASVAQKAKRPKFDELTNFIKSGTTGTSLNPYETGNPDLKPERAISYDTSLEYYLSGNTGVLAVNGYYRDIKDKIESTTLQENDGFYYKKPMNMGDAKLYGVEFDAKMDLSKYMDGLNVYGNLSFMNGKITTASDGIERKLKDVPEYALNLGFDQKIAPLGLTIGAAYNYLDGFEVYESATKLKTETARTIVDVYALKKLTKDLNLRISAKNITEVEKDKKDTEFSATTGNITKVTTETEYSNVMFFIGLEGKF